MTVVDSFIPAYGGELFNLRGIEDAIRLNISDVRDEHSMKVLIQGHDYVFNLAGQTSHMESMLDPVSDLEINAKAQLTFGPPKRSPVGPRHSRTPCFTTQGIPLLRIRRFGARHRLNLARAAFSASRQSTAFLGAAVGPPGFEVGRGRRGRFIVAGSLGRGAGR